MIVMLFDALDLYSTAHSAFSIPMSPTTPGLFTAETGIVNIQREMHHIESTVERPPTLPHYVGVSQRLNATASTIHHLPVEILSLIFQYSSPPPDNFTDAYDKDCLFHLTLRLVSGRWHHVVQSTPQLWTCITSVRKYVDEDFARYLQLCLDNSGRLPLAVCLLFRTSQSDSSPYLVSPLVDDALRCNLNRIRILQLHSAHILWLTVIPLMFELTSLRLKWMNVNKRGTGASLIIPLDLSENTKINDISLSYLFINNIKLGPSTSQVTQLDLDSIPIDICIRLYLECQRVKSFRCSSPCHPQSLAVPEGPAHILKRDSLLSLSWDLLGNGLTHWNDYVLKWTHFPALKRLWWTDNRYSGSEYDLTEFFGRLPQSLNTLGFSHIRPSAIFPETPIDHICPDSHVSEIVFHGRNKRCLNNIFQSLFKKTTAGGGEVVPFPRLVCISASISIFTDPGPFSSVVGNNLVQLLEERKGLITEFTFRYSSSFSNLNNWEAETWRRLDELKDGGLTINILGS